MLKHTNKWKTSHKLAGLLLAAVVLWALSALLLPPSKEEQAANGAEADERVDLSSVLQITPMRAEQKERFITLYGGTEVNRMVNLKAETQGTIEKIPVVEGQELKAGDVIVQIDERDRRAKLDQARAVLQQRQIEFKAAEELQKKGYQTEVRLAESRANLAQAKANLKQIEIDLRDTKLLAPFDGVLEELKVEVGDFVGVGVFGGEGALATVVDHDPLKIVARLSEKDRPFVKLGDKATAMIKERGAVEGTITYLGSVADVSSRTFRVEVEVPNTARDIPAGVTAELKRPAGTIEGDRISPAALALDDDGRVGVKLVSNQGLVEFKPVELLEDSSEGIWISGLPSEINLISLGHAFVSPGQQIDNVKLATVPPEEHSAEEEAEQPVTQ